MFSLYNSSPDSRRDAITPGEGKLFLSDMTEVEQASLLVLARLMIASDGVTTPEEQAMLDDLVSEMGLANLPCHSEDSVEQICARVSEPQSRAMILLELASFGHVDLAYVEQEKELLKAIAELWEVEPITLIRIEQWADRRIALLGEAVEVIQEVLTGSRVP